MVCLFDFNPRVKKVKERMQLSMTDEQRAAEKWKNSDIANIILVRFETEIKMELKIKRSELSESMVH